MMWLVICLLANANDAEQLEVGLSRFTPAAVTAKTDTLSAGEKQSLSAMLEAAKLIDAIYLRQVSANNPRWLLELSRDSTSLGQARLSYYLINKGPWSVLDQLQPFLPGVGPAPPGGSFYPENATKPELEAWFEKLAPEAKTLATSRYSVIRRAKDGFVAVPYSIEYQNELIAASAQLKAAAATAPKGLAKFLLTLADALLSDDYNKVAPIDESENLDVRLGPTIIDQDKLFNYKAAFSAFIAVNDHVETKRWLKHAESLQPRFVTFLGPNLSERVEHHVKIADLVFAAGRASRGVLQLSVEGMVANKKSGAPVMFRNVMRLKYEAVAKAIAETALSKDTAAALDFDTSFLTTIVHSELENLLRAELKTDLKEYRELLTYTCSFLLAVAIMEKETRAPATHAYALTTSARWARYGTGLVAGRAGTWILRELLHRGGIGIKDRRMSPTASFYSVLAALVRELIDIGTTANYARAKALYGDLTLTPELTSVLASMRELPFDIDPVFVAQ